MANVTLKLSGTNAKILKDGLAKMQEPFPDTVSISLEGGCAAELLEAMARGVNEAASITSHSPTSPLTATVASKSSATDEKSTA